MAHQSFGIGANSGCGSLADINGGGKKCSKCSELKQANAQCEV